LAISSTDKKSRNNIVLKKHDSANHGIELLKKGITITSAMLLAGLTVSHFGEELSSLVGATWTYAVDFVAELI